MAIFTKKFIHILKNNKLILQGHRNLNDGLWDVPLANSLTQSLPSIHHKNNAITFIAHKHKTDHEIAQYIQGCLFLVPSSTIQQAINKGNLIGWLAINNINFKKQPLTVPTCKAI